MKCTVDLLALDYVRRPIVQIVLPANVGEQSFEVVATPLPLSVGCWSQFGEPPKGVAKLSEPPSAFFNYLSTSSARSPSRIRSGAFRVDKQVSIDGFLLEA